MKKHEKEIEAMSNEAAAKGLERTQNRSKLRTTVQIGMLGAVSAVLMLLSFPVPFLVPPFVKMDFSELPVLIGAFAMGPVAGVFIELIKNLLNLVLNGSTTGGIGELSNFVIGCAFVVPAGLIYRRNKTKKSALIGMGCGTVFMAALGCLSNAFVMFPLYSTVMGIPMEQFVAMGTAINSAVDNLFTFIILCMAPFNLMKGIVISLITFLLYKRLRVLLKGE
ncbi:MAG TPA: ECF transporter S component [Candidatus Blautia merdavium]|uniref:Riboflavin transporter n=1 Tax=Candidatus Blautia merdavium TaxID=2838494 RepID=A0A9D2TDH3_9FIRM|nr:ECF transporter S component [Candidatus Blautia merdavium]